MGLLVEMKREKLSPWKQILKGLHRLILKVKKCPGHDQ